MRDDRADLGEEAKRYRALTRGMLLVAFLLGVAGVMALRGTLPGEMAEPALWFGAAAVLMASWTGWRGHRIALEERERASRSGMVIAIAAQLARQDDATLAGIAGRGGPAAEAAAMVLAGRNRASD